MSQVYFNLAGGNLVQDWSNAGLITTNDDWSNVPSFQGFLGQDITTATATNPGTLLANSRSPTISTLSPTRPIRTP